MTKQEFKEFCHEEFTKRGFKKRRNMWYLQGKDLLCGMYLQKSMSEAFYVEYDFFFGDFSNVKKYPTIYDSDVAMRIGVLTKADKILTGLIEYELYTPDELRPYFDKEFEEHIMPAIHYGKSYILKEADYYYHLFADDEWEEFLEKLKED
ncbi:MAG: DUF4304 domain-containing protein [[Ruminococcus] gnavus]|nr:DUF4304 domain-containing protein [Mediterraneibacter gnavus]